MPTPTTPSSMFTPHRRLWQRGAVTLLCAQMLLAACTVDARAPNGATAAWPEPAPQPTPPQVLDHQGRVAWPRPNDLPQVHVTPNFQAPSANDCARPIVTREIPGSAVQRPPYGVMRRDGAVASATDARRKAYEAEASASAAKSAGAGVGASAGASGGPSVDASVGSTYGAKPERSERRADIAAAEDRATGLASPAASPAAPPPPLSSPAPDSSRASIAAQPAPAAQASREAFAPRPTPRSQIVTAGMVDDNADFSEYLAFRARTQVEHRERDISERYLLQVKDARGRGIADAEVAVRSPQGYAMWARTDTAGRVWLHPNAFDPARANLYEVAVRKSGAVSTAYLQRGQKSAVDVVLRPGETQTRAKLDLVFLVDATGSMGDEIDKLKSTLHSIANDVARLPSRPDMCFGLVAYRDRVDQFLVRTHDLTNDLGAFQRVLDRLQADGGGDYPEAMNEAFHEAVQTISWRGDGATRLVVLLADAPPHLDYGGPQYDEDMMAALGKGIKVFSVGASGLDSQGEYIQRQIAQYTGGRFVFLTYADAKRPSSGPGRETVHDVSNYSVDTLDRLVVRLVSEELSRLAI